MPTGNEAASFVCQGTELCSKTDAYIITVKGTRKQADRHDSVVSLSVGAGTHREQGLTGNGKGKRKAPKRLPQLI